MKRPTKLTWAVGVIALVLVPTYFVAFRMGEATEGCDFKLDATELRALAASIPGSKATAVHLEHIATFEMPEAIVVTGRPWAGTRMPVYAYQLIFPDGSMVIDTGMSAEQTKESQGSEFDAQAQGRVSKAMRAAKAIYVTHEHADHFGGLVVDGSTLTYAHAQITSEQLAHPEGLFPSTMPEGVKEQLKPLSYDRITAVAPGVVLIKAPGHTPGSQLIFVSLENGTELLILGDTAWHQESVTDVKTPPRFVSWAFLHNDRRAHVCHLDALHKLAQSEPKITQIPGHDGGVIAKLTSQGTLAEMFR